VIKNSFVGRDFMTAISRRDQTGFVPDAVLYMGVFRGPRPVWRVGPGFGEPKIIKTHGSGCSGGAWGDRRLITMYLASREPITGAQGGRERWINPDQRIAEGR